MPALFKSEMGPKEFMVLMAMLMSIVAISIDAILPALGIIGGDFALQNQNHAQYVVALIFLGMGFGELFWGPLSDAIGRKIVLYFSVGIYLAGTLLCYFADEFGTLLAGRVIQGIGVAGPYITNVSVIRDKYEGRAMARIMSVVMMIFLIVPAIAPALGQTVMHYAGGWRSIFLLYIIYSITVALWLFFRLKETLPTEKRVPFTAKNLIHGFREVIGNRVTLGYMICMGICFGSFMGYLNSAQQIFYVQFNSGDMFSLYFGMLALVMGAASLTNSRLVEKLGMFYISLRAFVTIVISSGLFLLAHAFVEIELWMFLTYAVFLFFSFGLTFGNLNAIAMEPMGHIAGLATAVMGFVSSIMSMALGAFIGQLYNNTLVPIVTGFLVLGAVCIAIMLMVEKGRIKHDMHA